MGMSKSTTETEAPDTFLNSCNACDTIGVDPDSLAGYCYDCEKEARSQ